MSQNDPTVLQLLLEEVRLLRNDLRIEVGAVRSDLGQVNLRANEAHKRIDAHENRLIGWMAGIGIGAGGFGAFLVKLFN